MSSCIVVENILITVKRPVGYKHIWGNVDGVRGNIYILSILYNSFSAQCLFWMRYYWPSGEMKLAFPGLVTFLGHQVEVHTWSLPCAIPASTVAGKYLTSSTCPSRVTRDHLQMEQWNLDLVYILLKTFSVENNWNKMKCQ